MILGHLTKTAVNGILRNKVRSALTILGVVIGITSIMMVVSLGEGAQDLILGEIQSMGAKTIVIEPGREPSGPASFAQLMGDSLTHKDLTLLKNKFNVPSAQNVEPLNVSGGIASYGNKTYQASIFGSSGLVQRMYDMNLSSGRFIDDYDVDNKSYVAVIGSKVKEELFGNEEAVGEKIRLKGVNFRVVGVLAKKGQGFINFDEVIIIPWSTAQQYVFGIKHFHHIIVEVDKEENVGSSVRDIAATLRNSHDITDPKKDDFRITTQEGAKKQVETILNVFTLFLAAIAAISLVVGGVGIMNIMLVSVTERTREIGLRKSLGATGKDIMTQFLLEAVMLTALGGVIGIILGTSLSFATSIILSNYAGLDWAFSFPVSAALMGIGVSAVVGLVFGLYPARQASLKSPIEALRYE
jgi:putative ABC transport system permease protein